MAKNEDNSQAPLGPSGPPPNVGSAVTTAPVIDAAAMHAVLRDLVTTVQATQAAAPPAAPALDTTTVLRDLTKALHGEDEAVRQRELDAIRRILASHDDARAASRRITLRAVTSFTLVTDEHPEGRVIARGQDFEIAEFDLPRYLGRGLPPGDAEGDQSGVSITRS